MESTINCIFLYQYNKKYILNASQSSYHMTLKGKYNNLKRTDGVLYTF